jgi:hypothetical protein
MLDQFCLFPLFSNKNLEKVNLQSSKWKLSCGVVKWDTSTRSVLRTSDPGICGLVILGFDYK